MEKKNQSRERLTYDIKLEKAYNRAPMEILWKALEKKGVRIIYIQAIKDIYNKATNIRTQEGVIKDLPIKISLHQGLSSSTYIFTLVLDVLIIHMMQCQNVYFSQII